MAAPLLQIDELSVEYTVRGGTVIGARGVDLAVHAGETVALVGESGSGKSTTAHAVAGLLPRAATVTGGAVRFDGQDLVALSERRLRTIRGRHIGLIPQDPTVSLNPVKRIGDQVAEVLLVHGLADRRSARRQAIDALERAGIPQPAERARQHPHELSGGMRQRVLIAIALAASPRLVIADEPTSALDVTVQRQILDHIERLTRESGTAVLLITHDLGVAAERADRIAVMSEGRLVEIGSPAQILDAPTERYTRALIAAAPSLGGDRPTVLQRHGARPAAAPVGSLARGLARLSGDCPPRVRVAGLVKDFALGHAATLRAVDDVSFEIAPGRTFALVGESGSGKSTTARLLLRLTEPTAGRIEVDGEDVTTVRGGALRQLRRRMQVVYQNPYTSLNPRFSVGQVISDPLRAFGIGSRRDRRRRAAELVDAVALPTGVLDRRPAELSGGQRQRVAIARALALEPELVVLDEPVSALDVSVQAQILELLARLQAELGLT
jgi:peptide/nickel transport system ATP-binding protein